MLNKTRHLALLALFTGILLMTSLYAMLPFGRPRVARQEVDQIVIKTPRSTTQAPAIDIGPGGPKTNLYFLKTHKTGSSTLQNILVRYAWDNNLLVGLPQRDIIFRSYFNGMKFSKAQMQPLPPETKPNMLLHHMVFDQDEVASLLPPTSVYFTILRDPATQFESVFEYFVEDVNAFKRSKYIGGLKEYVTHPTKYFRGSQDGFFWWFGKNGVFFDLGLDNLSDNEEYINQSIQEVEKIFDLVLISEYFDISLLLLRDLLCWDMRDMAYLSMNRRTLSTVEHVEGDVIEKIYSWNKADTALYKHFNKTFWMQVDAYGKSRLEKDLQLLQKSRTEIADSCVENDLYSNNDIKDKSLKMFNPKGIYLTQYKLKEPAKHNETCRGLILPEVEWWKKLSRHQKQPTKKETVILILLWLFDALCIAYVCCRRLFSVLYHLRNEFSCPSGKMSKNPF